MKCTVIRIIKYEGDEAAVRKAIQLSKPLGVQDCGKGDGGRWTLTIAEHFNDLPQLVSIPDEDVQVALLADAVEARAKEIYATWSEHDDYRPWVEGGNSIMQDLARSQAYSELSQSDQERTV